MESRPGPVDRARPLPPVRTVALRLIAWYALAILLTWPLLPNLTTSLLGHPDIDVWNHAWGYWWVADSVTSLSPPYFTRYAGAPPGGVLYFIDSLGAVLAIPLTVVFGPGIAFNLTMLTRVAMTGLATQLLAEELTHDVDRPHTTAIAVAGWVAGAAAASSPYLMGELYNAISEVCNLPWIALTLLAATRAFRGGGRSRWVALGVLQALTTIATFYYGLLTAILIAPMFAAHLVRQPGWPARRTALLRAGLAAAIVIALAGPVALVFRASLVSSEALIARTTDASEWLMLHNAVDPLGYLFPGSGTDFSQYGEGFVHTAYLRWTLVILAGIALIRGRNLWGWGGLLALSLVMGLGEWLYIGGDWVRVAGWRIALPFGWLREVLPALSITHPLRLAAGGQIILAALAGLGASRIAARTPVAAAVAAIAALLVIAETLFLSPARWPLPLSPATVLDVYDELPYGAVLDLPAQVGSTMSTSRYFWYQTRHRRPIPYRPDARADNTRDPATFMALMDGTVERPQPIPAEKAGSLRRTYVGIVVHTALEEDAGYELPYREVFEPHFGPPDIEREGVLVWRFEKRKKPPGKRGKVKGPRPPTR